MITVAVIKDNKLKYGSMRKIAAFVGLNENTFHRWVKAGVKYAYKNGFDIYLDTEKL